jgi:hypothetical protein
MNYFYLRQVTKVPELKRRHKRIETLKLMFNIRNMFTLP